MCRFNDRVLVVLTSMLTVAALAGCVEQGAESDSSPAVSTGLSDPLTQSRQSGISSSSDQPPAGHPRDFFPVDIGTTWTYEIQLTGADPPLRYAETSWSIGGTQSVTYASRGIIFSRSSMERGDDRQSFELILTVKGPAEKQGPLSYPDGVELEVIRDELGIYENAKQVFWAMSDSGRFMANLVVTHDPDSPGAPTGGGFGSWGQGDGNSMRLVFFADRPGIQISRHGSPDSLLFDGLETNVKGFEGTECLHLTRQVEASDDKSDEDSELPQSKGADRLNRGFREQFWFARGKGLVRLEQHVDEESSMVWTLKDFSKTPAAGAAPLTK